MNSLRVSALVAALLSLACGTPEVTQPPGNPPPTPPAGPSVVSSAPAHNASNVLPSTTATVTFSAAVDPATVNRTNVHLVRYGDSCLTTQPSKLSLSSDGLTVTVTHAPAPDANYRLRLNGLKTTDGDAVTATAIDWQTRMMTKATTTASGATRRLANAAGRLEFFITLDDEGTDGEWHTEDDPIQRYTRYVMDARGVLVRQEHYTGAGVDGEWMTADDVVEAYNRYVQTGPKDVVTQYYRHNGAGPDGVWFNADDDVEWASSQTVDSLGLCVEEVQQLSAGTDGIWLTEDDPIAEISGARFNDTYDVIEERNAVTSPGADGIWLTDDDIYWFRRYTLDESGAVILERSSQEKGADGVWGTDDDVGSGRSTTERGAFSQSVKSIRYMAGSDGMWGTSDDVPQSIFHLDYDPETGMLLGRTSVNGPGTNGTWDDADDTLAFYSETLDGPRRTVQYNGPGTDGMWRTADDVISSVGYWNF